MEIRRVARTCTRCKVPQLGEPGEPDLPSPGREEGFFPRLASGSGPASLCKGWPQGGTWVAAFRRVAFRFAADGGALEMERATQGVVFSTAELLGVKEVEFIEIAAGIMFYLPNSSIYSGALLLGGEGAEGWRPAEGRAVCSYSSFSLLTSEALKTIFPLQLLSNDFFFFWEKA